MNPPEFCGSKKEKDQNGFIDEAYKTLVIIGLTSMEKEEQASYTLKDVAQVWYE